MNDRRIGCVIADDHEALRRGIAAFIGAERDMRVIGEAADGREALVLAQRRRPDVTIVDLRMPGMDGLEFCREAGAQGLGTSIVVYTGFEDDDALVQALDAGARAYVLKSGAPSELLRAIRMVDQGHTYVDAAMAGGLLRRQEGAARHGLSARELQVLRLLGDGLTTEQAAAELFLSPATVRSYAENAMRKLEARNRVHAVAMALRDGLIT